MKGDKILENWLKNAPGDAIITVDGVTYRRDQYQHTPRERKNKYNNRITYVDGIRFDSKAEANRYSELLIMERAGLIKMIKLQPRFEIHPRSQGQRAIHYIGDFMYVDLERSLIIVEDVKGGKATATQHFKDKAKLFRSKYPQYKLEVIER